MSGKSGRRQTPASGIVTENNRRLAVWRLYQDKKDMGGWRAAGERLGVSGATAYRFAVHGHEPKRADLRCALGLPAFASVPVCSAHGVAHLGRCPRKKSFEENAAGWDEWKAAGARRLAEIVAWAETRGT